MEWIMQHWWVWPCLVGVAFALMIAGWTLTAIGTPGRSSPWWVLGGAFTMILSGLSGFAGVLVGLLCLALHVIRFAQAG